MLMISKAMEEFIVKTKERLPIEIIEHEGQEVEALIMNKTKDKIEYINTLAISSLDYRFFDAVMNDFWDDEKYFKQMIEDKDKATGNKFINVLKAHIITKELSPKERKQ